MHTILQFFFSFVQTEIKCYAVNVRQKTWTICSKSFRFCRLTVYLHKKSPCQWKYRSCLKLSIMSMAKLYVCNIDCLHLFYIVKLSTLKKYCRIYQHGLLHRENKLVPCWSMPASPGFYNCMKMVICQHNTRVVIYRWL